MKFPTEMFKLTGYTPMTVARTHGGQATGGDGRCGMGRRRLLTSVLAAGMLSAAVLTAGPALAGKPPPSGGGGGNASCQVSPNPVALGAGYTVLGSGLTPGGMVNVLVSNSGGSNWWSAQADTGGRIAVPAYANWRGANTVKITTGGRRPSTLATCSFSVT